MISGELGVIRLNHLGVAVPSIDKALPFYEQFFGYKVVSGPFYDPIQNVSVSFLGLHEHGDITLELVEPKGDQSPVSKILKKDIGAYHLCLEVQDMDHALAQARLHRCVIVSEPVPAVAFNGRLIAWFYTPTRQLVEILAQ
jgi:methylmalonyl-CoA/ethylmalonyl-CoA epimerase